MKRINAGLFLMATLMLAGTFCHAQQPSVIRVMTYNIRFDNPGDGVNRWGNRREALLNQIRFHNPDIICIQEGLHNQVEQITGNLSVYKMRGKGRDDGATGGEYSAVFFRDDRFEALADSTFWLSPTPSVPGKAWDAALPRIATWVRLKERTSGKVMVVFSTHFDHMGVVARRESAKLLLAETARIGGGKPVILAGDFNSNPKDEPHRILTSGPASNASSLTDSRAVSKQPHFGSEGTCCGFEYPGPTQGETIDFVFVSRGIGVLKHSTPTDMVNGHFLSDHLPVLVDFVLE
jgi:endonuclease/exonuclease/phosphatase family metal-dependent hydrolase